MKFSILIPARGEVSKIDQTIKNAESLCKIVKENGFDSSVLVSDNRKAKDIPLTHASNTKIVKAEGLLAYQNFRFLLDNCECSHGMFLALEDRIEPGFILKALSVFNKDRSIVSIMGKIYTLRKNVEHTLFESSITKFNANYFIRYPFGWGIYSLFKTDEMKKAFETDCDWTDYIITGNLCKTNIQYLNTKMRFYPVNEERYSVKSQGDVLNPFPWIKYFGKYIIKERKLMLPCWFRIVARAIRDFWKWYLNGGMKN